MKRHYLVYGYVLLSVYFALQPMSLPMFLPDGRGHIEINGKKAHMLGHINLAMRDYFDKKPNFFLETAIVSYSKKEELLSYVALVKDIKGGMPVIEEIRNNNYVYLPPVYVTHNCLIGGTIFTGIKEPDVTLYRLVVEEVGRLIMDRG